MQETRQGNVTNKRNVQGDVKEIACHESKSLCKVPARRWGGSKNFCVSVNIPREIAERERSRVLVQEPRQELVIVTLRSPVSKRQGLGDIPRAFAHNVPS